MLVRVQVLGPVEMLRDGEPRSLGPQLAVLLGRLVVGHGRAVPTVDLLDALWPDHAPDGALSTLRSHVAHLRRLLGPDRVASLGHRAGSGYLVRLTAEELDATVFESTYRRARQSYTAGDLERCVDLSTTALQLWRGRAFGDISGRPSIDHERARLDELARATRRIRAESNVRLGDDGAAITDLSALLDADPLDEAGRDLLVRTLYQAGQVDRAAVVCTDGIRLLQDRGLDASDLERLQRSVLRREPGLGLGHRPVPDGTPDQLPPAALRLVGRERELADLSAALENGPGIVVLHGPAGVGKTTLAIHAARRLSNDFPDGILYAELRQASPEWTSAAVLAEFLRALGVRPSAIPATLDERVSMFRTVLSARRVLIVMDNATCELQVRPFLPGTGGSRVIVSSRSHLSGLDTNRIRLDVLAHHDALALLAQVAGEHRVKAESTAADQIVRDCAGLPLAVWVAGARLSARPYLPLATVSGPLSDTRRRLDELSVGDVAVRSSLELTYQALPAGARLAFRRIGITSTNAVATWALAAAAYESLAWGERRIDELIDVHLVEPAGPNRFRVHDLVRLYAEERALAEDDPADREAAVRRVIDLTCELAHRAADHAAVDFRHGVPWTLDNRWLPATDPTELEAVVADPMAWYGSHRELLLRLAEHASENGLAGAAGKLATALVGFLQTSNDFDTWRRIDDLVLRTADRASGAEARRVRLAVERDLGELETIQDRYDEAARHFASALTEAETLGRSDDPDDRRIAAGHLPAILSGLGYLDRLRGRYADALLSFTRALDCATNPATAAYAVCGSGVTQLECGHTTVAESAFNQALVLSQRSSYRPGEAQALRCLAMIRQSRGELQAAEELLERAADISARLGDRLSTAHAHTWLAQVWNEQGHTTKARSLLDACLAVYRASDNLWGEATVLGALARTHLHADLHTARALVNQSLAIWRRLGSPYWIRRHEDLRQEISTRITEA
ncbi:AfsR/SARP family transcriptional regulator [Flindersiella endophytica]